MRCPKAVRAKPPSRRCNADDARREAGAKKSAVIICYGDAFWGMGLRTTLADALHQAGLQSEVGSLFREAEEMRLHQADCHLEYARLYLAMGKKEDARKCLDVAREMVDKMEYHRRDNLKEQL